MIGLVLIQCLLALVIFLIPFFVGFLFNKKTLSEAYLFGQISLWALFQVIAVPMIFFRCTFDALWLSYSTLVFGLSVLGIKKMGKFVPGNKSPWHQYIPYAIASLVILSQMAVYVFGMHLDEDDARWLAEANDALVKNRMLLHNPATGEYIGRFVGEMQKDVFSPWSMHIAVLSKLTHIPTAVLAHTVYPPILLGISYLVYYRIGRNLFQGTTERGLFLMFVSIIHFFFGANRRTLSTFALTRIWQGKAVVAAIMIPLFLLMLLEIEKEDTRRNWLWLAISGCASCLPSGMGIAISLIMIAVFGGYAVICKRFKRIPYLLAALFPSLLFGFLYFRMTG